MRGVCEKLSKAGLKVKPSKCEFFRTRFSCLGHMVSENGIEMNIKKIEAITNWPKPVPVTDVRSFFGLTNYYRLFIP